MWQFVLLNPIIPCSSGSYGIPTKLLARYFMCISRIAQDMVLVSVSIEIKSNSTSNICANNNNFKGIDPDTEIQMIRPLKIPLQRSYPLIRLEDEILFVHSNKASRIVRG